MWLPPLLAALSLASPFAQVNSEAREIAFQIQARVMADQEVRTRLIESLQSGATPGEGLIHEMAAVDRRNTRYMKEVVDRHGWPTSAFLGKQAAHDAFLLVQHADLDPKFQMRCLKLMEPMLETGQVRPSDYAYLFDRVARALGKPQRYGTQFTMVNGDWKMAPTEDPKNLDKRRKAMGMPPMKDYEKVLREVYGKVPKGGSAAKAGG